MKMVKDLPESERIKAICDSLIIDGLTPLALQNQREFLDGVKKFTGETRANWIELFACQPMIVRPSLVDLNEAVDYFCSGEIAPKDAGTLIYAMIKAKELDSTAEKIMMFAYSLIPFVDRELSMDLTTALNLFVFQISGYSTDFD